MIADDWRPYEILVKSEGGKTKIIDVTISRLVQLHKYNPIFMIDVDKSEMDSFVKNLEKKLCDKFRGANVTARSEISYENSETSMHRMELAKNGRSIGIIYVIMFNPTFEKVSGIFDTDADDVKRIKAKKYIQRSRIHTIFSKAFQ